MYTFHRLRFRQIVHAITNELREMAPLDAKGFPGVASELHSLKSSASTPSLRSSVAELVPMGRSTPVNEGGNVRVVVRVRGFLPRETKRGAECLIEMDPTTQSTTLLVPNDRDPANAKSQTRKVIEEKKFTFDNSFWSHNTEDKHYAHQGDIYNALGEDFLDHNFEGYHTCIFAYGQTGSGKSYTMMGTPEQPGLIPRTCEDLFERIESNDSPDISYSVRVSYFEVYNEHVRDLLAPPRPSNSQGPNYLKIREHPLEGPYVKDLTDVPVKNYADLLRYMRTGDSTRTTASTKMNDTSSRSHAVFTIMLRQIHHDLATDATTERTARIRLVDLAGSERAKATEATGARLREGSNINKSLTTLGRVIAALADPRHGRLHAGGKRGARDVVPYRDSILTWLLKDSLGGNSKTAMIACIAPSDYDETLSTLRYADQAKHIRTRAIVNQDSVSAEQRDAEIAEMQNTIRELQLQVSAAAQNASRSVVTATSAASASDEKLEEYQEKVARMQRLMEEERLVHECKIRQLVEQNEALRRHLHLAVESLRNPLPVPETRSVTSRSVSGASVGGGDAFEILGVKKRVRAGVDSAVRGDASTVNDARADGEFKEATSMDDDDKENAGSKLRNAKTDGIEEPAIKIRAASPQDDVDEDGEDEDEDGEWPPASLLSAHSEADVWEMQSHMQDLLSDLGMFRRKVADDHTRFGIRRQGGERGLGQRGSRVLGEIRVN